MEEFGLTSRERDVLVGLAHGNTAASIADDLYPVSYTHLVRHTKSVASSYMLLFAVFFTPLLELSLHSHCKEA